MFLNLVERANRSGFVNRDHHGLRKNAPAHVMSNDVFSDPFQAIFSGDEMVFSGELPFQLPFLIVVQVGSVADVGNFFRQLVVGELKFRDSIFAVEGNRVLIVNGFFEVVDRYVFAEDFFGSLFITHGVPVKPMKAAFGRALRMLVAKMSYRLRCASSVITMMSDRVERTG